MPKRSATSNLEQLVARRSLLIVRLQKFKQYIEDLKSETAIDLYQLRSKRDSSKNFLTSFMEMQEAIEIIDGSYEQQLEGDTFEQTYHEAMADVNRLLDKTSIVNVNRPSNTPSSSNENKRKVNLPAISIPKFSGRLEDWTPFFDIFSSLVHQNMDLDDIEKFYHLKSALSPEAAQCIEAIPTTAVNYKTAWELLKQRFQNNRLIVQNHIDHLHKIPQMQKQTEAELRALLDCVEKHVHALDALGYIKPECDPFLTYIIIIKLDYFTKIAWEETLKENEMPTYGGLLTFLKHKYRVLQSVKASGTSSTSSTGISMAHKSITSKGPGTYNTTKTIVSRRTGSKDSETVLLSTAIVDIIDRDGRAHSCRALLDSGSQANLITEELCHKLNLNVEDTHVTVSGLNNHPNVASKETYALIKSRHTAFKCELKLFVINEITGKLPSHTINKDHFKIPDYIALADETFHVPTTVDLLIGAEEFWTLLCVGQYKLGRSMPVLQKTKLGWTIGGKVTKIVKYTEQDTSLTCAVVRNSLSEQLEQFWALEECTYYNKNNATAEERECEEHFRQNTTRTADGRYMVKLPLSQNYMTLGNSWKIARKRLDHLEKRFDRDTEYAQLYKDFLYEYNSLGHMQEIHNERTHPTYYIPHHGIVKQNQAKIRVVFDASSKTSSKLALNDILLVGPKLQNDLLDILLRFRYHSYVISADIEKMYRNILVHPDDRHLQCILWRENKQSKVKAYCLNTVTYGTACAPYLAIRCLHKLAEDEQSTYPDLTDIVKQDYYVDDVLTGSETIQGLLTIKNRITSLMESGGFKLHKWCSNIKLTESDKRNSEIPLHFNQTHISKTLGLMWDPQNDVLRYNVNIDNQTSVTKRHILSIISQIFDPLGLINPVVITAKIIIQELWQLQVSWDDSLPVDIHTRWVKYNDSLKAINDICIPRHIKESNPVYTELHSFSDASEKAYAACIYMKCIESNGNTTVRLLTAKSRVAPLKTITLPRLELCGALLAARLCIRVTNSLRNIQINNTVYWCDSTITLAWIKASANKWKVFVANRVSEIQELSDAQAWKYVPTAENPADILSRGMSAQKLNQSTLWWHGPQYLRTSAETWPAAPQDVDTTTIPEERPVNVFTITTTTPVLLDIISKHSTLNKLVRVVGYIYRFINNTRKTMAKEDKPFLTTTELRNSLHKCIHAVQIKEFPAEIKLLEQQRNIVHHTQLLKLHPFLDASGILRVGGRLEYSNLSYDSKHQILLPSKHHITHLIIADAHHRHMHAGPQATLAALRRYYWPLSAKSMLRKVIGQCVRCFRSRPIAAQYVMGQLPAARVQQNRPFSHSGIDFAGPFSLKQGGRRSRSTTKAYAAIFVCFATKAIHIELVSDLSADAFLAALRRFTGRRGKPIEISTDNGTNFVGAYNQLREIYKHLADNSDEIGGALANDGIKWHFIPARSPSFGGLWESAVKATKTHLRRVIGETHLTFEEMTTLLVQIEACLNSRPLIPLSTDPTDFSILTPGHFLIGDSLTAVADPNVRHLKVNRLSRWQHTQQMTQHFWARWSREYLHQLQSRSKWATASNQHTITAGTMVLLVEDNLPPQQWKLGRVCDVHPGVDNIIRVVSVKTANGVVKRALNKVCPLPLGNSVKEGQ